MLLKQFHSRQIDKKSKSKFIPFVNQRNFMGNLLQTQSIRSPLKPSFIEEKNHSIIQNIKKSTKEYFFDKKFKKMMEKLRATQRSLRKQQFDYERKIHECFESLKTYNNLKKDNEKERSQQFYLDLNQKLNEKMMLLKEEIEINNKIGMKMNQNQKVHRKASQSQEDISYWREITKENENNFSQIVHSKKKKQRINKLLFKKVSPTAGFMADFANQGLKYTHLVKDKKQDPWKKWYVQEELELFPGEKIKVKKMQKSIY